MWTNEQIYTIICQKLFSVPCVCSSFMCVFLDVYSVLCVFYLTTCVCIRHSFHGPLREFCDAAGNGGAPGWGRYQGHCIRAHNRLSDLLNLVKARFAVRNSALIKAIFHYCPGSHFSGGHLCQGTATATRLVPCLGACTACPSCVRVLCTCLRVPCPRLCVCQPVCLGTYTMSASACGACAGARVPCTLLHVPSLCLCVCFVLHLVDILNSVEFPNFIDSCRSSGYGAHK